MKKALYNQNKILRKSLFVVLITGLICSLILIIIGGYFTLLDLSFNAADYGHFKGGASYLTKITEMIPQSFRNNYLALIQVGIVLMILTPVFRVLSCLIIFFFEKDYVFVFLAGFILIVLGIAAYQ